MGASPTLNIIILYIINDMLKIEMIEWLIWMSSKEFINTIREYVTVPVKKYVYVDVIWDNNRHNIFKVIGVYRIFNEIMLLLIQQSDQQQSWELSKPFRYFATETKKFIQNNIENLHWINLHSIRIGYVRIYYIGSKINI